MDNTPSRGIQAPEICECLKKGAFTKLDTLYKQLVGLYSEMGVPPQDWSARLQSSWSQVTGAMQEEVEEEKRRVRMLSNAVNEIGYRLLELSRQLGIEVVEPDENLSLMELERHLQTKLAELEARKAEIMQKLQVLRDEEAGLCTVLEIPALQLAAPIPQEADFHEVRAHIQMLRAEREKREAVRAALRQRLVAVLEQLERSSTTQLESDVVWSGDNFSLAERHLAELEAHIQLLEAEDGRNRTEATRLRATLDQLWQRLETPKEHREAFLSRVDGHGPGALDHLRAEVATQQEVKLQNMEAFVRKLRVELEYLWDRCYFSQQQRDEFRPYLADTFTEEVLDAHERELETMKQYLQHNERLLKDVDEHQRLWRKMLELEERATDHNRYMNRGGRLLIEEKERKKIARRLPTLERDLQQLISDWEEEHGSTFTVHGYDFAAFIEQQKAEHEQKLDRVKEERANKKATRIQHETMFGARPTTPAATQRRVGASPSKRRRLESTRQGAASPGPLGRTARTPLALFNPTATSSRNVSLLRTAPGKLGGPTREISVGSDMTYADFARDLQRLQTTAAAAAAAASGGQSPALRAATRSRRRRSQRLAGLAPRAAADGGAATPRARAAAASGATPGRSRLAVPSPGRATTPRPRSRALLGLPAVF